MKSDWSKELTDHIRYSKAPIIEATISLGVVPPSHLSVKDLAAVREHVQGHYPKLAEEYFYAGEVSVSKPGEPPEHDDIHEHMGYRFVSEDEKRVVHARLDSFDFTVRQPYDSWEPFRNEARDLWGIYRKISGVREISRLAVRYINRIDIPGTSEARLDHYLHIYPEVPDEWPSGPTVQGFFMQLQMWQEDLDCMLIINEAPGRPPNDNVVSIRLDFDLFREFYDDPWQANDDSTIWDFLERLRTRKNEVFEASITNTTRRLIE